MLKTKKRLLAAGAAALVLITALLCIFTAVTVNADSDEWDGTAAAAFAGGTGTSDDPYLISTAEQLAYLAAQVNSGDTFEGKYIKLTDNILLNNSLEGSPKEWTPIGAATSRSRVPLTEPDILLRVFISIILTVVRACSVLPEALSRMSMLPEA